MKKYIIKIVFCFLTISAFSQELRLVEKNIDTSQAELILLSIDDGNERIIKSFSQPLMLYFDYSFYIDKINKNVYFLSSSCTGTGSNGTMSFRYDLEKFDVVNEKIIYTTSCKITETAENKNVYFISSDGYLERNYNKIKSKKLLVNLSESDDWCN